MQRQPASLYTRLGGYDAIAAVVDDLLPRLRTDELLSRFWTSPRSVDTNNRERQLAIDFIVAAAGGPTIYLGRDMKLAHKGMGITKADYAAFMRCLAVTMDTFEVPKPGVVKSQPSPPAWNRKSSRDNRCRFEGRGLRSRQPVLIGKGANFC